MSVFEFITILLSIIVGLGIIRILSGFGRAIEIGRGLTWYWIHTLWMANIALYLVTFWWITVYSYRGIEEWTFMDFSFLVLYAVLLYLQSVLIIPKVLETGDDLRVHFFRVRPWFFSLGVAVTIVDGLDTVRHGLDHFLSFGYGYIFFIFAGVFGNLIAASIKSHLFHAIWAICCLFGMNWWIIIMYWTIK